MVVDKPRGPTSHDVVSILRRSLRTRAIGHAGTLDPMATGVLVVAIGEATKLVPWLTAADKTYEATVALGVETDTLDALGREVRRDTLSPDLLAALRSPAAAAASMLVRGAIDRELARTLQVPPIYSAIRTDGERSFERARRGEHPAMEPREVCARSLTLLGCGDDPPHVVCAAEVSKGFYVRSLARDLAEGLSTVGHVTSLRRTRSGCFTQEEACPFHASAEELRARVLPLVRAAERAMPIAHLTEDGARDARFGRVVASTGIQGRACGPCAWINAQGDLVAVGEIGDDGRGRVLRGFGGTTVM
ncbi:MAG: tRNA pseudouridine(55) synthase TruB, partial [Polyangiaceae bacterium]